MPDINKSSLNIELSPRTVWTVHWSWSSGRSTLLEDEEGFDMIINSLLDPRCGVRRPAHTQFVPKCPVQGLRSDLKSDPDDNYLIFATGGDISLDCRTG